MTREEFDKQSGLCFSAQENLFVCKDYINSLEQLIKELEAPKTCDGCKYSELMANSHICMNCKRIGIDYYEPKDK